MPTFQIWKPIVVVAILLVSLVIVYPSIQWYSLSPEDRIDSRSTAEMRGIEQEIEKLKAESHQDEIPAKRTEYEKLKDAFESLQRRAIPLGLDLQGGIHAVLEVKTDDIKDETAKAETVERSLEIIRNRIDQLGVLEPVLQRQGLNRIVVEVPGITDPTRIIELLGQTARLEFRLIKDAGEAEQVIRRIDEKLGVGILEKVSLNSEGSELEVAEEDQKYVEQVLEKEAARQAYPTGYELVWGRPESAKGKKSNVYNLYLARIAPELTGEVLKDAKMQLDTQKFNEPYVTIQFDKTGASKFRQITGDNVGKRLAIVLDKRVYSAPEIREKIPSGNAQITGRFTMQEAYDLGIVLRAGSLPADIEIVETRAVGPSLGMDSIAQGLNAAMWGSLAVLLFMAVYYLLSGVIADFAVVLNVFILVAAMSLFKTTLTLPGIAGIVLTVGMAVDANVLINERIREELRVRRDKALALSIDKGYSRAFLTIFDSNLTTLISAVALFIFGTGPIRGFAITLSLGLIISMFTAIFVTRIVFDFMTNKLNVKQMNMGFFELFRHTKIDFMRLKNYLVPATVGITLIGLISIAFHGGMRTNIDFSGGHLLQLMFEKPIDTEALRTGLAQGGFEGADIQKVLGEKNEFIIRVKEDAVTAEGRELARTRFQEKFKKLFTENAPGIELTKRVEQEEQKAGATPRDEYTLTFQAVTAPQTIQDKLKGTDLAVSDIVVNKDNPSIITIKAGQGVDEQLIATVSAKVAGNPFELRRQEKVGARVGKELTWKAIYATLFSMLGILLYVGYRFRFSFATGAVLALFHDILIVLGVFSILDKEVSLNVVAALLTIVGYSINDTIVVFDRIRENLNQLGGPKDLPTLINNSINQTLSRTVLTVFTVLLVLVALFFFGGVVIHDFAFAMLVGVATGCYSSIYIASPIVIYWERNKRITSI